MQATASATLPAPRFGVGRVPPHHRHSTAARANNAAMTGGGGGSGARTTTATAARGGIATKVTPRHAASVAPFRNNRQASSSSSSSSSPHARRRRGQGSSSSTVGASASGVGRGGEGDAAANGSAVYPLDSGGKGWDPVELHELTGMVWAFTTPSSADGRKIIKDACEKEDKVSLKGSSAWRKDEWAAAAAASGVVLLESYAPVPGMRGFRAVWAPHGIALLYVPGVRRFYTMRDVDNGAAAAKSEKGTEGIRAALRTLSRANASFAEAYAVAVDADAARTAAAALQHVIPGTPEFAAAAAGGVAAAPDATDDDELTEPPRSCIARWCVGAGVDAPSLYLEYGVGFDFHGPAGVVSRGIILAVAEHAGQPLAPDAEAAWAKQRWVDAMASTGVTYRASHAPLSAVGRGWKVCWVADAVEKGCPAVMIWAPEDNAYFTLGSLAAAASSASAPRGGPTVEAAIRAVVAVAKSTPAPPGLKAALTKDGDFLTLLGRKPKDGSAPVSAGTTGGVQGARVADAAAKAAGTPPLAPPPPREPEEQRVPDYLPIREQQQQQQQQQEQQQTVSSTARVDEGVDGDEDDEYDEEDADHDSSDPEDDGRSSSADADDDAYFRPAPPLDDYEFADSRSGLRRRPSRGEAEDRLAANVAGWVAQDMLDEPMATPGFEDVPGMEGFVPDDRVTGQGEFFSRSAGYLSFVDGSWSKEDLAREMGADRHRDDPPVTPRDFPDKSLLADMERQSAGGADLSDAEDYKELFPRGLPRPYDAYHPLRLHGIDYLVAKTNDGRLDFREVLMARRREDGNFAEEAQRVNTAHLADMPPAYYHEAPWTERDLKKEEKHIPGSEVTEFDTLTDNTKKVYMVWAANPLDAGNAYNRQLDFSKPVVSFDDRGGCARLAVRGAEKKLANAVLVVRREGELYLQEADDLPNWETVCAVHDIEQAQLEKERGGPDLHADFLKEVDDDYIPDDTPEVDNF